MTTYIIRRLLIMPLILFGVTILIFAMLSQLSVTQRLALYVPDSPRFSDLDGLAEQYGLNDPLPIQYGRWLGRMAHGDLGFSKTGKQPVGELIVRLLPASIELALWSVIPILALGIWLGVTSAVNHNRFIDHALRIVSITGTSIPSFVLGLLLLMLFAGKFGWLPTGERLSPTFRQLVDSPEWISVTRMYTVDAIINGRLDVWLDALRHLILPVVTLAYISLAVLQRVTRSSMLDTLRQDYVRTARAKGLSERAVVMHHARPNALLPVVTIGGALLIGLLNGAAITETIFNWPGIGKRFVDAATNLDIITILGFTVFQGGLLIVGNLIIDMLYAIVDPRVRLN